MFQNSLTSIRSAIGHANVLTDADSLERFSFDALNPLRTEGFSHNTSNLRVKAVLRPGTTAEVSAVVKWAKYFEIGLIPYGGGTGVMGGVIPTFTSVTVDMSRMNRILEIEPARKMARVQPGVVLEELASEVARSNLLFAHDPWSRPVATVGGAVSTDGFGYLASRYGSMGDQVIALEAVIADGSIIRTQPLVRQSSGPQLNGIFVGAEGTMGIITEITVQLFSVPEQRRFATFGFASFGEGFSVVRDLFDVKLIPALMDLTEEDPGTDSHGYRTILYLGFDGPSNVVEAHIDYVREKAAQSNGVDLGPGLTDQYWFARHASGYRWRDSMKFLLPSERWKRGNRSRREYLHVSLPVSEVLGYKSFAEHIVKKYRLNIIESAVWTDPGLFSLLIESQEPDQRNESLKLGEVRDVLLGDALSRGGGIEYCHGVGSKLSGWQKQEWGDSISLVRAIKQGLDSGDIFNPGKIGLKENS